jgi:hypothetical protein
LVRKPMTNTYLEHPAEDALERYLMHRSDEQEIELVETHTLACDSCVARLESLEIQIAAMKLALQELHNQAVAKAFAEPKKASWRQWLTAPRLAMAGAALALVLGIGITAPRFINQSGGEEQVSLSAYRGLESPSVPKNHKLDVSLSARGLDNNHVSVQLVDGTGAELWHGTAPIQNEKVEVKVPALTASGAYLFRLYAPPSQGELQGDLLREFAFKVN